MSTSDTNYLCSFVRRPITLYLISFGGDEEVIIYVVIFIAYMEIGTLNVSTVIGRYLTNVAMTTNKFQIPYFVTSAIDSDPTDLLARYNVVAVLPVEFQLPSVTFDLIHKLGWSSVVILYSTNYGKYSNIGCIYFCRISNDLM